MILHDIDIRLKDGRAAVLRSPVEDDAEELLRFVRKAAGETEFLMRYPEEYADYTLERERSFISGAGDDPDALMIACIADGKIVANSRIDFRSGMKDRHRATVAIAVLEDFWGLGIGTRLFEEMFKAAEERGGVRQLELDFIEGNARARSLYEKLGFRITGVKPDAIRLKDGSFVNEYMMVKRLV